MLETLRRTTTQKCLLEPNRPLIVGVSGGPDSLCLLDSLHRLGYSLVVAHLDHQLRAESQMDAQVVEGFAQERSLPFAVGVENVPAYAKRHSLSLEEAARHLRYKFLFQQATQHQAQAIAVGHNAGDQVETMLMHLLRGAGLDGLKGMTYRSLPNTWSQVIPLVRPLLSIWREQINAYLHTHQLIPIQDASNQDTTFYRNSLRHNLIPYLDDFAPGLSKRLWQTADILGEDHALLEIQVEEVWAKCLTEAGEGYRAFAYDLLKTQPTGMQRRLLRRAISGLRPGTRDIDFAAIERAIEFIAHSTTRGQADLIAGLRMMLEGDQFWLANWEADLPTIQWPQVPEDRILELPIPGRLALSPDWELLANSVALPPTPEKIQNNPDPYQAWFDLDTLQSPVSVRVRCSGDRMQPQGMEGRMVKISDLMINLKLPSRARAGWPLVCFGDQIVWLPGLRQAHPFRVTASTQTLAHFILRRQQ